MEFFAKKDGPGAMEKMVANMLGFTPEQMAATLTDFRDTIVKTADRLERIETMLTAQIDAQTELLNHVRSERANRDGNGDGGTLASSGGPSDNGNDAK